MTTGTPSLGTAAGAAPAEDATKRTAGPGTAGSIAIHLLMPVGLFAALAGALIAVLGSSESMETALWVLAIGVALPAGLFVAGRQTRALASAPPTATGWGVALGLLCLGVAMLLRDGTGAGRTQHATIALAGLLTLAGPFVLVRESRWTRRLFTAPDLAIPLTAVAALVAIAAPFLPDGFFELRHLGLALLLAAAALALVMTTNNGPSSPGPRRLLDLLVLGSLALVVLATPDIAAGAGNIVHHHDFFLGPANDVLHGRAILVDTFSQYGVGIFYVLALAFQLVPIGYGGLLLIGTFAMVACYSLTYVTLRAAIGAPVLVIVGTAVAVLGNIFLQSESYVYFPSTGPLRFGLPYVLIACAVMAARFAPKAPHFRLLGLVTLAVAAVWSLETFVYTAAVYAALVLLEAYGRPGVSLRAGLKTFIRGAAIGIAVAGGALATLSFATLIFSGSAPDWSGYLDYIALYSTEGLGQLPVDWFSTGPVMGLAIFLSAAGVAWLARDGRAQPPLLVALAGFTAFAVASFTYYLGRSHPNNLAHLMVPVVALGTLWVAVLLRPDKRARPGRAAIAVGAVLLAVGTSLAVAPFPLADGKWSATGMAQVLSYLKGDAVGTGLRSSLAHYWDQPVIDPRGEEAAQALARVHPGHGPVVVLTEPELTTEILLRAGRRNILPLSNPAQDNLVDSTDARVRAAIARLRPGALMLTSDPQPRSARTALGRPAAFNGVQRLARADLQRRFRWRTVTGTASGLKLVRLESR